MRALGDPLRTLTAVLVAALVLLVGAAPAAAAPSPSTSPRPTVDPAAPTPTAPYPAGPPQGSAPDGSTVGGEGLDTRGLVVAAGAPPLPAGIDAHGWVVADADTGEVLAAQDPHGRYYPASTLKTLTLLTLFGQLDPALVVEGTAEDANMEGSRVGLVPGGQYTVQLLFTALVLQSGNDAANALARAAGGVPATVAAMNETAERIGAYDTVAGTPSGLDVAGQSSSAYDLCLIMRQLVDDPGILAVLQTRTAQMPAVPGLTDGYQIQTQDSLLTDYPGTLGGKTGFTDAARHTFVAAAARDGRRLVVSLMQAERRPVNELDQAELLLDWGFGVPAGTGVGTLVDPGEVSAAPVPTATAGDDGVLASTEAAAQASAQAQPTATASLGPQPLLGLGLAAGALAIVVATLVGRRRAVRPLARTGRPSPADRFATDRSGDDPRPGRSGAAAGAAPPQQDSDQPGPGRPQ